MRFVKDPVEKTTAATDIILAFVAFGGIVFLRSPLSNSSELWKINIWSAAMGLIGWAAALGAVAHGLVLSQDFSSPHLAGAEYGPQSGGFSFCCGCGV